MIDWRRWSTPIWRDTSSSLASTVSTGCLTTPPSLPRLPHVPPEALKRSMDRVGWERWWTVLTASGAAVGHLSLKGAAFDRGLHRCELGMGLERPYVGRGLGTALIGRALDQARAIESVDWLDLRVLSGNEPGLRLYRKTGFVVVSWVRDFCRIDGVAMDNVQMSQWVGAQPSPAIAPVAAPE